MYIKQKYKTYCHITVGIQAETPRLTVHQVNLDHSLMLLLRPVHSDDTLVTNGESRSSEGSEAEVY